MYACFQIKELNAEIKEKVEEQQKLEEKRKEEIAIIKKVPAVIGFILEKQSNFALSCKQCKHFRDTKFYLLVFFRGVFDLGSGGGENSCSIIRAREAYFEESFSSECSLQVHEREHDREISELAAKHSEEMEKLRAELKEEQRLRLDELRQQMEATHRAEHEQAQLQSQVKNRKQ